MSGLPVSVIIPARNEAAALPPLLEALSGQSRKPDEVIVVDAGSLDGTAEAARRFSVPGLQVRVLEAGPKFPGGARNAGIAAAANGIVAMTDAGCVPEKEWLSRLVDPLERGEADYVFGSLKLGAPDLRRRLLALAVFSAPSGNRIDGARVGSFVSFAVKKDAWTETGGFREDLRAGEDTLMVSRLESSGLRGKAVPGAMVTLEVGPSFREAFAKLFLYSSCRAHEGLNTGYFFRLALQYCALSVLAAFSWGLALGMLGILSSFRAFLKLRRFEAGISSGVRPGGLIFLCALIPMVDIVQLAGAVKGAVRRL